MTDDELTTKCRIIMGRRFKFGIAIPELTKELPAGQLYSERVAREDRTRTSAQKRAAKSQADLRMYCHGPSFQPARPLDKVEAAIDIEQARHSTRVFKAPGNDWRRADNLTVVGKFDKMLKEASDEANEEFDHKAAELYFEPYDRWEFLDTPYTRYDDSRCARAKPIYIVAQPVAKHAATITQRAHEPSHRNPEIDYVEREVCRPVKPLGPPKEQPCPREKPRQPVGRPRTNFEGLDTDEECLARAIQTVKSVSPHFCEPRNYGLKYDQPKRQKSIKHVGQLCPRWGSTEAPVTHDERIGVYQQLWMDDAKARKQLRMTEAYQPKDPHVKGEVVLREAWGEYGGLWKEEYSNH